MRRIYLGADIADEVSLAEQGDRLWRDHRRVFDNPPQATILITNRQHKVLRQLLLEADHVLLCESELRAGQNRISWVLRRDAYGIRRTTCSTAQQVSRINNRRHSSKRVDNSNWLSRKDSCPSHEGRCEASSGKVLL